MTTRPVAAPRRAPGAGLEPDEAAALAAAVRSCGQTGGLDAVGFAPAGAFHRARRVLEERKRTGLHAGMQFTYKNPERSTTPALAVRGARTVVVGARRYDSVVPAAPTVTVGEPAGRVARYAWIDHYGPLRSALWDIARLLRADGWKAVAFADDNSIVDREAAHRAGIGWYGKNANLLLPGRGSWFVLGAVVTDAPLPVAAAPVEDGCGTCRRCLDGCPTGAIVAPGVVDARRCLAWLVQAPDVFPMVHREALGDRIYGCDDCQEVCPPNRRAGAPVGGGSVSGGEAWVGLLSLLAASDDELLARHGRWYLHDRDPRYLRRNALLALGNIGDAADLRVRAAIGAAVESGDSYLRAHAVWAAARLGYEDLVAAAAALDSSPAVAAEVDAALSGSIRRRFGAGTSGSIRDRFGAGTSGSIRDRFDDEPYGPGSIRDRFGAGTSGSIRDRFDEEPYGPGSIRDRFEPEGPGRDPVRRERDGGGEAS